MNPVLFSAVLAGPLDNVNGLPTHPLVIHGAIGLVLLAALGGLASLVPRWRPWLLPATAVVGVLAAVSTILATESGESLERRLPPSDLIETHAEAGELTRTASIVLAFLLIAWWAVDRMRRRAAAGPAESTESIGSTGSTGSTGSGGSAGLRVGSLVLGLATAAASVLAAAALAVAGDQGAQAVWEGTPAVSSVADPGDR